MLADLALPYRTDWREMSNVLDYCKGKGADRPALEARFGAGESLRETLNALEQLGLIVRGDAGDIRLSVLGERLAYAPDAAQQRDRLVEAMLGYAPYRFPLERAVADRLSVLDAPWVEHIWQVDMRLGQPRNRVEEARTFFFRLADEAGLGSYRRGVRGQTTRLDLAGDFAERVPRLLDELASGRADRAGSADRADRVAPPAAPAAAPTGPSPAQPATSAFGAADATVFDLAARAPRELSGVGERAAAGPAAAPALTIHVDMSGWDIEKIAAFLRLIGYPAADIEE